MSMTNAQVALLASVKLNAARRDPSKAVTITTRDVTDIAEAFKQWLDNH